MVKYLILAITLLAPTIALSCNKKVNKKSIVLFMNINRQDKEKAAIKKAACDRGDHFVEWPSSKRGTITKAKLKTFVTSLEQSGKKIRTIAISGHNGGISIYSDYVRDGYRKIHYRDLIDVFKDKQNGITKNIESIYLMGCYTGSHYKYRSLKEAFNNTSLIAGYNSMAPLGSNPLSYKNVVNMMKNERKVQGAENREVLKKTLSSTLNSVRRYRCSAYVKDKNGTQWFFNDDDKASGRKSNMRVFSGKLCDELTPESVKKMTRSEILTYISSIGALANARTHFGYKERRKLKKYQTLLNDKFKNFKGIPASWHEKDAYLHDPLE